jgi:drug/metabolite transporter (DMT)-like permease
MDNGRGVSLMILAMAAFAVEDAFIKTAALRLPTGQILSVIGAFGLCFYLMLMRRTGTPLIARGALHPAAMLRLAGEILGSVCFVSALTVVPLATASAILQALPLALTAAAALFLAEPVGWRRWSAVLLGLVGVLMIIRPGVEGFIPASLLVVAAVAALALRDIATGRVPRNISSLQLSAWVYVALVPTGILLDLALGRVWVSPDTDGSIALAGAVVFGILAYWSITEAMRAGEISFIAPFRYSRLVFSLILAVVFLGERPDGWTLAGAAVIIATGLYTFWRERMTRRPATPAGSPIRTDLRA